jgi:hypothetical protein
MAMTVAVPAPTLHSQPGLHRQLEAPTAALFGLRDECIELSLLLKDWQFETELEPRKSTENSVRQLL